jgi:tRNA(Ile)-lysidine synthase
LNFQQEFIGYINEHQLFQKNDRLLLAVSGGIDSVVLCELLKRAGYDFAIAHCNFQLREKDSEEDECFVKSLASKYQVEFFSKRFDTRGYTDIHKVNIQIAARDLRYTWFNEMITKGGSGLFRNIVTGHHANDNVETVVMNFFKGTGIKGLKGMSPKESGIGGKVVRPLLFATKEMILNFAVKEGLEWREDESNKSSDYTRNYFRNEMLPALQKLYPQVENNVLKNIDRLSDVYGIYEEAVLKKIDQIFQFNKSEARIPILKLLKTKGYQTVLFEGLKPFGFHSQQIPEVLKLLQAESGSYLASDTHRLIRHRRFLIITPIKTEKSEMIVIEEGTNRVVGNDFSLQLKTTAVSKNLDEGNWVACLDADLLTFH